MKAPFPYFGGKSAVAKQIWSALGDPDHYIEPFFGSGAVLLNRSWTPISDYCETVNDKDGLLCNVWRALQADPDAVAKYCDWPVNHADLCARRRAMIADQNNLLEKFIADTSYYDAKLAGFWIWSASCWIGSGLTNLNAIPHISHSGIGVHAIGQIPHISHSGIGVHAIGQIPHISNAGKGVQDPL